MRLFVRLEDNRVITLRLPEKTSVTHAKQCIVESGRSTIATTHQASFRLISGRGMEMKNEDEVEDYALAGDSQRVYAILKSFKALTATDIGNNFETIYPPANTTISSSPSAICVQFLDATDLSQNYEIYLRTDRAEIVEGTMSWEETNLVFTPAQCLQYNRSYVVHVDSVNGDFEWMFSIASLSSLRLLVNHHENDVRVRSSLINIPRQSPALYTELLQLIAKRFKVPVHTICKIMAMKNDGVTHEVINDRDVGELSDFYSLVVSVDTTIPKPPDPPAEATQLWYGTATAWAEHNENHWVNDASGCLAVCGKMTDEEENDLLLQVVEAFSVCEDNHDVIAADAGIAISLNAESMVPMASVHIQTGATSSGGGIDVGFGPGQMIKSQGNRRMPNGQGQGQAAAAARTTQPVDTEAIKQSLADAHVPDYLRRLAWTEPSSSASAAASFPSSVSSSSSSFSSSSSPFSSIPAVNPPTPIFSYEDIIDGQVGSSRFADHMRQHTFAVIRLPPPLIDVIQKTQNISRDFFLLPSETKDGLCDGRMRFLGYSNNTLYDKQLFQMRRIGKHSDVGRNIWPRTILPTFERILDECYTQLHAAALTITQQLLLHAPQLEKDNNGSGSGSTTSNDTTTSSNHSSTRLSYINSLFECSGSTNTNQSSQSNSTAPNQSSHSNYTASSQDQSSLSTISGQVSMTNLTAFKYHVPKGEFRSTVHCPHHSDISLLTIIPTAVCGDDDNNHYHDNKENNHEDSKIDGTEDGKEDDKGNSQGMDGSSSRILSGLHCWDLQTGLWLDVEKHAPPGCAVVFTGECMGELTRGRQMPCMHEVANVGPGSRLSLAFQFCPAEEAVLSSSTLLGTSKYEVGQRVGPGQELEAGQEQVLVSSCIDGVCRSYENVRAGTFIDRVSRSRISSNFPRLFT